LEAIILGRQGVLDPMGLPEGQFAAPRADGNPSRHQDVPQPAQLEAEQPPQAEAPADALTVSPPPPLVTNPQADISRHTFALPHAGQSGFSLPNTSCSNSRPHALQWYSYMGIFFSSPIRNSQSCLQTACS